MGAVNDPSFIPPSLDAQDAPMDPKKALTSAEVERGLIAAMRSEDDAQMVEAADIVPTDFVMYPRIYRLTVKYLRECKEPPTPELFQSWDTDGEWKPINGSLTYWLGKHVKDVKTRRLQRLMKDSIEAAESDPDRARTRVLEELAKIGDAKSALPSALSLADALAMDHLADLWLVMQLIKDQGHNLILGQWGAAKSWALLDLAVALSAGQPWLGRATRQTNVLIVDEDNILQLHQQRLPLLAAGRGLDPSTLPIFLLVQEGVNVLEGRWVSHLIATVKERSIGVVIIEMLRRIYRGEENSSDVIEGVYGQLKRIRRETGATTVLSHHPDKQGRGSRGSGDIETAADTILQLSAVPNRYLVKQTKNRWAAEKVEVSFMLTPQPGAMSLTVSTYEEQRLEEFNRRWECVEFLYDLLRDGERQTVDSLKALAKEQGYTETMIRNALAKPTTDNGGKTLRSRPGMREEKIGDQHKLTLWRVDE